jgi:hypothetical protein
VNKLRTAGLLNRVEKKKKKKQRRVLIEKLVNAGAILHHTPRKSVKHLAQEAGVSK